MTDEKGSESGEAVQAEFPAAETVIERFGGIRPAAAKLGMPVTTVQGWKNRGRIPDNRHEAIRQVAADLGIDLVTERPEQETTEERPAGSVPTAGAPARTATAAPAGEATAPGPEDHESPAADDVPPAGPDAEPVGEEEERPGTPMADSGQKPPSAVNWIAVVVAVVSLAVSAMLVFRPDVVDRLTGGRLAALGANGGQAVEQLMSDVGDLQQRLDQLATEQAKLASTLETRGGTDGGESATLVRKLDETSARLDATAEEMVALSNRVQAMEDRLSRSSQVDEARFEEAVSTLRGELDGLKARVATLADERAAASQAGVFSARTALLLSVGQLEAAVRSGASYRNALERARTIAAKSPGLLETMAPLEAHADSGVPTIDRLEARLEDLESRLVAGPVPPGGRDVLQGIWARVKSTVSLRRIDEGGSSPITRTERALAEGDLAMALRATEGFGGAVEDWRRAVRARLAVEGALRVLGERALARQETRTGPAAGTPDTAGGQ